MSAPAERLVIPTLLCVVLLACAGAARAQSSQSAAPPAEQSPGSDKPEMDTHDTPVPLEVHVSLVPVRVVVRDSQGQVVPNLHREDFEVFEDGKPQQISNFLVETLSSLPKPPAAASPSSGAPASNPAPFVAPSRFVALLFDDAHLNLQELTQARIASGRYLDASVTPADRVAVFTISGQTQLDFTDDRDKLHDLLRQLLPRTVTADHEASDTDCPPMDDYEANLIQNNHDQQATEIATQDAISCLTTAADAMSQALGAGPSPATVLRAQELVTATALRVEQEGEEKTEAAFRRVREIIQRMSSLPGQKSIVLISPGFIYPNRENEFSDLVDRAIRSSIFINTLDARGLYVPDLGTDISRQTNDPNPVAAGLRSSWRLTGQDRQSEVLTYLSDDTGGYAFHSNNDLGEGLRQVVAAPAAYYYIAFAPQNLKYDGRLHSIKVTLRAGEKYTIQARREFYAPRHGDSPADIARQDIEDAVFSQEEQHGLPVALQTQFYKTDPADAKLAVLAHVDLGHLRFLKADGRNQNDLTVVAALFDRNGNFITGMQRVIQMNLRDETLAKLSRTGVTVRTNFDVKPGDYVVRLVVRDSKAAQLSAENGAVEIPY